MAFSRIEKFKRFSYRNSESLVNIDVSPSFLFVTRRNGLDQYFRNVPLPIKVNTTFTPVFSAFYKSFLIFMSKHDLYCFRNELVHIGNINALTLMFFCHEHLISIDESKLSIFHIEKCDVKMPTDKEENDHSLVSDGTLKKPSFDQNMNQHCKNTHKDSTSDKSHGLECTNCFGKTNQLDTQNCAKHKLEIHQKSVDKRDIESSLEKDKDVYIEPENLQITLKLKSEIFTNGKPINSGLCSSYFIYDNDIYLGFENGDIGTLCIDMNDFSRLDTSENRDINLEFIKIVSLKEPILHLIVIKNVIFAHSLSGIYRFTIDEFRDIHKKNSAYTQSERLDKIYTNIIIKNICVYKDYLIASDRNRLLVLDFNLKILNTFVSPFEIKKLLIYDETLFVGFECGLVVEYDLCFVKSVSSL